MKKTPCHKRTRFRVLEFADSSLFRIWDLGFGIFPVAIFYLLSSILSPASAQVVTYPLSGNLRADEGTIEMWVRLETEPDGSQRQGSHYFPLFQVQFEGEKSPRILFNYQTIWSTNAFHFFLSCSGKMQGVLVGNPYIATVEDTQATCKADKPGDRYPRTPRLKKSEWHYVALTWSGEDKTTVALYLDGKQVIRPFRSESSLWAEVEGATLSFMSYVYHDDVTWDDFRISSVARTEKEMADAFAKGALDADKFTLLLDKFEDVQPGKETHPITMAAQTDGSRIGRILAAYVEQVDGKTGKGLKIKEAK